MHPVVHLIVGMFDPDLKNKPNSQSSDSGKQYANYDVSGMCPLIGLVRIQPVNTVFYFHNYGFQFV
jgi:hypothetical protein